MRVSDVRFVMNGSSDHASTLIFPDAQIFETAEVVLSSDEAGNTFV